MASIAFGLFRADLFKKIVSQLKQFAEQVDTATFNFSQDAVSLLASSQDGHVLAALRMGRALLTHYTCHHRCSLGVSLFQLCTVLDLADDGGPVDIRACDVTFQFIIQFQDPVGLQTSRNIGIMPPNPLQVAFDSMPRKYAVKAAIPIHHFMSALNSFFEYGDGKVALIIRSTQVELTNGPKKFVFSIYPGDCIVAGIAIGDRRQYVGEFNLGCLMSIIDSFIMTRDVWIYASYPHGIPPVLMCPNIDQLGSIMFYFLNGA